MTSSPASPAKSVTVSRPAPPRVDAYSRHPLRGPLGPAVVGPSGAAFVPISARNSPFINVDGRVPPRRPRRPLVVPAGSGLAVPAGGRGPPRGAGGSRDHMWSHSPFSQAASRVLIVNPMHIVNLSEHTKSSLIKIIEALKRFSEKWFSHVLLLLFLAIYACLGAYIFISFEAPHEHFEKKMIVDMRMRIVNDSWNARDRLKPAYFELLRMRFEEYEHLLNRACAMGMSSSSLESQWTFWGALFYSMTVFTTIGYGHLTPITFGGRIATMIYAIFGIPILLMVLADLGKLLTRVIKYGFNKLRLMFWRLFRRKGAQKTRKIISDNTNQYIGVAKDAFEKGFAYIPYVPQALRSNSLKSNKNQQQHQHVDSDPENQTTSVIVTTSAPTPAVSPNTDPKQPSFSSPHSPASGKKRRNSGKNQSKRSNKSTSSGDEADTASKAGANSLEMTPTGADQEGGPTTSPEAPAFEDIDDEFDLPVSVALMLLVMYMMFGAIIFSAWEGWGFFDSLYFVFISMSTIGFGDLVPQHPKRMMATFIYLLFGLALTSMCINVVQEKIHATFLRAKMQIGEKMGLDLEQIMADDYYDDNYDDEGEDGDYDSTDDTTKSSTMNKPDGSEPSSANNSMKSRKKSTGSSSGNKGDKEGDKRKISSTNNPASSSPLQDRSSRKVSSNLSPQIDQAQNHSTTNSRMGSKSPVNNNSNNNDKISNNTPYTNSNNSDINKQPKADDNNANRRSTYELKLQPASKLKQQQEKPMPAARDKWEGGKFSVV